ncbi:MAG: AmmeMemoRadiSam system protein A [Alphaproteobacteria bacterium]|nr:AmmeMemoRadiSam system protein A [Alphaproteobacteria bacterium]
MKQDIDSENIEKHRRLLIITVVLCVLLLCNYLYFSFKVSSNHALASHYTVFGDPMEKYRNPIVAGIFTHSGRKHIHTPKIVILPEKAFLQGYLQDFSYPADYVTFLLFDKRLADEIFKEKQKKYYSETIIYDHSLNLDELLLNTLEQKGRILIVGADLQDYYFRPTINPDKAKVLDEIINAAKRLNLAAEVKTLADKNVELSKTKGFGANKENTEIYREYQGLKEYANHFGGALIDAARQSLNRAKEKKSYSPERKNYDDHLFDKGASFVTLYYNGGVLGSFGSIYPTKAMVFDVVVNTKEAFLQNQLSEKLSPDDIKIKIALLTGFSKINYKNEEEILAKIRSGVDGIVIRDGDRQALFLPEDWQKFNTPRKFLNALKLKAGISPNFWADSIQVYRFQTVEIKEDED